MLELPDTIRHSVAVIDSYHTAPKKLLERVQQLDIAFMLNNREFRKHLKLEGVERIKGIASSMNRGTERYSPALLETGETT